MTDLNEQETALSHLLTRIPAEYSLGVEHREELRAQMIAARARRRPDLFSPGCQPMFGRTRRAMRRPVTRWIALAAACIALATLCFYPSGHPAAGRAFAFCAEAIVNARSVTYTQVQTIEGGEPQISQVFSLPPDKLRVERADGNIDVYDYGAGKIKMLNLMPSSKTAWLTVAGQQPDGAQREQTYDFFGAMRDLLAKGRDAASGNLPGVGRYEFKSVGEKEIDGRRVVGFRYAFIDAGSSTTLWGDPASGEPVLVEAVVSGAGRPRIDVTLSHFKLNSDLDPKLFDTAPPADYEVQTFDGDAPQPAPPKRLVDDEAFDQAGGEPAKVEFFLGEDSPAPGLKPQTVADGGAERTVYLQAEPFLTQDDVAEAHAEIDNEGRLAVAMKFTEGGAEKMGRATGKNVGKQLAIVVNGKVVSTAIIRARIYDAATFMGRFSDAEAKQLARDLSSRRRKKP